MPVEIFCCYARKDLQFLNELKTRLTPFQRQGLITLWADTDIGAGIEWEEEITKHLNTAQIILLLVSPDFLASDYIYRKEMKRAMERNERKEARVIPIILRKVHWQDVLGHLQALPRNGKEVTSWPNQDDAFYDVTNRIIQVAREFNTKLPTISEAKPKATTRPEQVQSPSTVYDTESLSSAATPRINNQYSQQSPSRSSQVRKGRVSRRVVLSGLALMVVAGGIIWLLTWSIHSLLYSSSSSINLTLIGTIVSVDPTNHVVTLNVNGQTRTITNVPPNVLSSLQGQVGKVYSFQLTQNSDGTYSIEAGTNATPESNGTSSTNETPTANEPGSIQFIGTVRSVSNSSIVVSMPDGSTLTMSIVNGQTDLSSFGGALPGVGELIQVSATANKGSFTTTILAPTNSGDVQIQNTVTFQGVMTQAVGSDRVIHFAVGNRSFSFPIASTAFLADFSGNAQSIANGSVVKVTVQFSGTSGTAIQVSNP